MGWAFQSVTTRQSGNGTVSVNYPTSLAVGDTVVLRCARGFGAGITFAATGFDALVSRNDRCSGAILYHAVDGTEGASVNVTVSGASGNCEFWMERYSGGPPTQAALTAAIVNTSTFGSSGTGLNYPALTIGANPNCLVLGMGVKQANLTSFNLPAIFTAEVLHSATSDPGQAFVSDYAIQTTATDITAGTWTVGGDTSNAKIGLLAAILPGGAALAGTATAASTATGDLDRIAGTATATISATAALSTAIRAAGSASASSTAVGALINWTTVTLSGAQYTGSGGIHDPNFWLDVDPAVGTTLYYDATHITIYPNGEISSDTNNCSAVVQFFDGTAWSYGLVILTPQMVTYAHVLAAAAGALTTGIKVAGAAIVASQAGGGLATGIHLAGIALGIANAAASLTTGLQLNAAATANVSASGALSGGVASLQGSATTLSQALGALTTRIQATGQVIIDSQMTGALSAQIVFRGAANALTQAAADLTAAIQFVGNANVVVTATGAALISSAFAGAANVVSTALGSLKTGLLIAGNALVLSAATGDLSTGVTLSGAAIVDTAAALRPVGLEGQFGYASINVLSTTGLPVTLATFIENSACIVSVSYFSAKGLPFTPNAVNFRVDDEASGENLVPWTPISEPSMANAITITSAQNSMVNLTRSSEQHEVLFQITDGVSNVNYASAVYELIRVTGTN